MDDKDKMIKQLQGQVKSLQSEIADVSDSQNFRGYSCARCGSKVNLSFPIASLKASGLCPNCYHAK